MDDATWQAWHQTTLRVGDAASHLRVALGEEQTIFKTMPLPPEAAEKARAALALVEEVAAIVDAAGPARAAA